MDLLILEKNKLDVSPYALCIKEFKAIWDADKSKDKDWATKALSYIVMMCKFNSPYINYQEDERHKLVCEELGVEIDKKQIAEAIKVYNRLQEDSLPALRYLYASRIAAEKIRQFYLTFDLNERSDKGAYLLKPKDISSSITDMERLIRTLDALEEKVKKEMELTDSKIRGGGLSGEFENPE